MSSKPTQAASEAADGAARDVRRRARRDWPMRRYDLGDEPAEDLRPHTTADERLAMVWPLTLLAWRLSGRPMPDYERSGMPGKILRREESD